MGISNTIPPSRLIQPGVVANTAARPTSPFTGQCIYQVDTNQMLIWNGTAWVIPNSPAQNPTGLEFISSTALSGGSITVSNCFSSTYDNYRIVLGNGATSNTGVYFYFQWTVAGTPSTVNYGWSYHGIRSDGLSYPYRDDASSSGIITLGQLGMNPQFAGAVNNMSMDVFMPFLTARSFALYQSVSYPSPFVHVTGGISQDQSTSKDGFKLGVSAGTFTGTVSVYGYRK